MITMTKKRALAGVVIKQQSYGKKKERERDSWRTNYDEMGGGGKDWVINALHIIDLALWKKK